MTNTARLLSALNIYLCFLSICAMYIKFCFLNLILPVDDFEFNVEQFLPVSLLLKKL